MSYFEGLKLTKKGEQLQAKINGNLSETLTFTKAKLGSGSITSNDEIRFLTDVKEEWGTANVASCEIQGDENNIVAIELQFSNAGLREDKIFREIGLYARGNEGDEILYAYANAGDKYDYIPLIKDSPHSFVIVIYFNITSGTKVDANIDLHSYITLQKFNEGMSKKENIISKKSGFNLEKTDSFKEDDTNKLATAKALKSLHDEVDRKTGAIKLNWDSIKDKPSSFVPSEHNHNSLYYTETEVDEKLENNILYSTGKTYGGLLNEPGVKSAGKAYWDNNTKKLYICKNNNSDISPNVNNYIPFDSNSLLERLENLFKINSNNDITTIKFGNVVIVYGTFRNVRFNESTDIVIPVTFKNASISAIPWHTGTPGNLTTMAYVNGNKITIRVNNSNTGLQNASGTFITTGIV